MTAAVLALVTGCATSEPPAQQAAVSGGESTNAPQPSAGSAVRLIDELDRLPLDERPDTLMASVRPRELVLTDQEGERVLPLPDDRFYLSVAPYVSTTHECFYHSLTTCTGELGDRKVHVTATDDAGRVLLDRSATTFDNGFLGLWLPRDVTGTLTIRSGSKRGQVPFGTGDQDPTCLTTLRLS